MLKPIPYPAFFNAGAVFREVLPAILVLAAFVALWHLAVEAFDVRPFVLPTPGAVLATFFSNFAEIAKAGLITATSFVGGFLIASVVGIGLATLIVLLPTLGRGIYPLVIASQTIPVIAVAPLLIIWLGFGAAVKVAIAAIVSFFPIVVSSVLGFRSVRGSTIELMRALPASRLTIFRKLMFPSALPTIFAGLRTGSVLAVIGSVVGEFVAGGDGIAGHIIIARSQFQTDRVMADILGLALLGAVFYGVVALIEYWALPWKRLSFKQTRQTG
ncbi:ABC transporter permease [Aquibium sp. A9E412]|uniref:ABC transporter permease n=1 Tax=Aquibium sp. A9E412 TaxID=2976767 RepID=UPI0025B040ED|nr:ABC transporter permease [Aquibium sp. A9E412]MDN2564625.1 ABC transporter permease [Aquibium sp. A9E412]